MKKTLLFAAVSCASLAIGATPVPAPVEQLNPPAPVPPASGAPAIARLEISPTQFRPRLGDERVQRKVLDPQEPMIVGLSGQTTSVLYFPKPIHGVMGYGLATSGDDLATGYVHCEHPDGSPIVALRALRPFERLYMTVLMEEEMYVFELRNTGSPVVALKLVEPAKEDVGREVSQSDVQTARLFSSPEDLVGLLKKATSRGILQHSYPSLYAKSEFRRSDAKTDYGAVICTVTEIHRFSDADATVLIGSVSNNNAYPLYFNPVAVAVSVGKRQYPVQLSDASGTIPAKGTAAIAVVLRGDVDGSRSGLSVKNDYRFALPAFSREPLSHAGDQSDGKSLFPPELQQLSAK